MNTKARILKLCKCLIDPVFLSALIVHRVAAASEHRCVITSDLATIVDIGANRGQFSLAVRRWAPDAKVFAFEPLADPSARFRELFRKDSKVCFNQSAIGPTEGETAIHVSANDDSSSLLPITDTQTSLFPGTEEVCTETVEINRLNKFLSTDDIIPPSMLKIDVQGFELPALVACEDLLYCFSYIYVECSFLELYEGQTLAGDIIAWLTDRHFIFKGIYNTLYDSKGMPIQGDFLFRRNKVDHRIAFQQKTAVKRKVDLYEQYISDLP